jgi:hypothetical protein
MGGFRWLQLKDTLDYYTYAPANVDFQDDDPPYMDYEVATKNDLYGFQLGGDLWACLIPGLNAGVEGKFGIYGNDASQRTSIYANSIQRGDIENASKAEAAFVGELDVMLNYRVSAKWTLRLGWVLMMVEGVALGPDNFNSAPPGFFEEVDPPNVRQRVVSIDTSGSATYMGWTFGAEYLW